MGSKATAIPVKILLIVKSLAVITFQVFCPPVIKMLLASRHLTILGVVVREVPFKIPLARFQTPEKEAN